MMLLMPHEKLLTSDTVEELLYNHEFNYSILITYEGERYMIILPEPFISLIIRAYDLVHADVVDLEDRNGVFLPFSVYRKRTQHIAYAMTA